jgi:hypothetical protein
MQIVLTKESQDNIEKEIANKILLVKPIVHDAGEGTFQYLSSLGELGTLSAISGKFNGSEEFSIFGLLSSVSEYLGRIQQTHYSSSEVKILEEAQRIGITKALKFATDLILTEINHQDMVS